MPAHRGTFSSPPTPWFGELPRIELQTILELYYSEEIHASSQYIKETLVRDRKQGKRFSERFFVNNFIPLVIEPLHLFLVVRIAAHGRPTRRWITFFLTHRYCPVQPCQFSPRILAYKGSGRSDPRSD